MEGGFITKLVVGGILMGMFISVMIGVMVNMGSKYGINLETDNINLTYERQQNEQNARQLGSIFNNASVTQLGSTIDSQSQNDAQFRGFVAGEQKKTNTGNIFSTAIEQIYLKLPFDPIIKNTLLTLIGISLAIGVIYLIFKVLP